MEDRRLGFSLPQVQAFSVVGKTLSYVQAASLLGYSQPAVHNQIKRLEAALGCSLVMRSGRGLKLTPDGVRLLPQCVAILREADLLPHLAAEPWKTGAVSLAGGYVTSAYMLPNVIAEVRRRAPEMSVDLHSANRVEVMNSVRCGESHIGISHGLDQIANPDDFIMTKWRDIEYYLISAHVGGSIDGSEVYAVGSMTAPLSNLISRLASHRIITRVSFVPSADAVKSMCIAGLGLGFVRRDCAVFELSTGIFQPAPIHRSPIKSSVWAIQSKVHPISRAAQRFLDMTTIRSTEKGMGILNFDRGAE